MPTSTSSSGAATTSGAMDHGDHGDDGGMMGGCKISMLLNYNTIDSCFISSDWRITSTGMFAGSCIGIALLAIFLEFLRRAVKQFDRYLVQQHQAAHAARGTAAVGTSNTASPVNSEAENDRGGNKPTDATVAHATAAGSAIPPFRPTFWQQAIRAILHTSQFTVAYFIMLLGTLYKYLISDSVSKIRFCA